jgi:hypothetical protein
MKTYIKAKVKGQLKTFFYLLLNISTDTNIKISQGIHQIKKEEKETSNLLKSLKLKWLYL